MSFSWRGALVGAALATVPWLVPRGKPTAIMAPGDLRPAIGRPGADGSGATGRVGDSLQWEIYAERPELGRAPVTVWVHGNGWAVTCSIRPPGSVPASGCVTVKEPVRVEGARR